MELPPGSLVVTFQHIQAILIVLADVIGAMWIRITKALDNAESARIACEEDRKKMWLRVERLERAGCGIERCSHRKPIEFND